MLHLHLSNRTEALFLALSGVIASPLQDVFQPEVIVVEEPGMARWLSQQLAEQQGIAANIAFPLPAGFVWRLISGQLQSGGAEAGFGKGTLLWYSMALLPALKARPGFEPIRHYLSGAEADTRTYQLSRQIADLFDQYLVYRPDWIRRWEAGEEDHWQAQLWRAMRGIATEAHWAGLLEAFRQSIETDGLKAVGLPRRLSLFGLSALSTGYIELLALVGAYIDVHLYVINPSVNYWGDIVSEQDLARLRDTWRHAGRPDVSELYSVGNPLLASMGKPCRDFLDQWHDFEVYEHEYFRSPGDGTLLARLQDDILNLQARGTQALAPQTIALDDSIQVHACHSPMREVQVLHDRLLDLFERLPDLKPHEIVVQAPDIAGYAPFIESVFGAAPPERHIPFSIAGQPITQHPLVETLLSWLQLPVERFEAPTVLGWLELPAIQARFGLDEEAVERIRDWVDQSGIRWGVDGGHKSELGLPENALNTWEFGFNRLFLGYAMPAFSEHFGGVAPYQDIEGSECVWLGQLRAFIDQLVAWRKRFAAPATPREWQGRINRMIEQLLQPDQEEALLMDHVREQVARMVASAETAGFAEPLSAATVHQHLAAILTSAGSAYHLFTGKVTFCNMVPVRAIPFRVVCLLGMNDGAFPRNQRPLGFDRIAQYPRKGDRSLREDDRYLFLQALLSSRAFLHISYIGRSQQDNSERLPSVLVTELLDYIEQGYRLEAGAIRAALHTEHALQPFSPQAFAHGSYAAEWLARQDAPAPFADIPLPPREEAAAGKVVSLEALIRFLVNPSRHFLEQRLGIQCAEYEAALADSERFELDPLAAYALKMDLLSDLLDGKDGAAHFELILARGALPHGGMGRLGFEAAAQEVRELAGRLKDCRIETAQRVEIALALDGLTLSGRVANVVDNGVVRARPAKVSAKDRLALWTEHLALCAAGYCGEGVHLGSDTALVLAPLSREAAIGHLQTLLDRYRQGTQAPLPFLLNASYAYAKKRKASEDRIAALSAAMSQWESSAYAAGDGDDPWVAQAFRDRDPFGEEFEHLAGEIWLPMLACLK